MLSLKIYIPKPKLLIRFKHCLLTLSRLLPIASPFLLLTSNVLLISHFSFSRTLQFPYLLFLFFYAFTSLSLSSIPLPLYSTLMYFYLSFPFLYDFTTLYHSPLPNLFLLLPHIPLLLYLYLCSPFPTSLLIFPLSCIFTYISHFPMSFLSFPICSMHLPHFPLLYFYLSL